MSGSAAVAETHSAVVFFVGDRAYKLKKPVDLGFLDFSTRQLREEMCHREVALNRRLAPDVYEGVADVVGPDGVVCDHLVVMKRLPDDRRLSTLVESGTDVLPELRAIARVLGSFHATALRPLGAAQAASRDAVRTNWEANAAEMSRFADTLLPADDLRTIGTLFDRYLDGRAPLFAHRIAEGRARDGHGDLLADDIFCLADGPRIIDCLEFADRLRLGDVLLDVAFLAMDLEDLGRPDLGAAFLSWWREFAAETYPPSLADHYTAYRAQVRAKVACLRTEQGDDQRQDAARLLAICRRHLESARVRLVVVGGLPGTGKSTLAAGVAEAIGATVLRSDEVRKELAGVPVTASAGAGFERGIYAPQYTASTYSELLDRAEIALGLGQSVVIDASWTDARWRERATQVAASTVSDLSQLRCALEPHDASRRIRARAAAGGDSSDATPAIAATMADRADDWPEATRISTSGSIAESLASALAALGD